MEFGRVTRIRSKYLNDSVVVYQSVKQPGYVYKFSRKKDNEYRCCRRRELGKQRVITVVDDVVVGRKDPESDHHPDCVPLREESVTALSIDRDMRNEVNACFNDLTFKLCMLDKFCNHRIRQTDYRRTDD